MEKTLIVFYMRHSSNIKELEKLENLIFKKAYEINPNNNEYYEKLIRPKYPPMSPTLCPWKEFPKKKIDMKKIKRKKRINRQLDLYEQRKKNKIKKQYSSILNPKYPNNMVKAYRKNLSYAQQYNVYPVKRSIYPTPAQFLFMGDEDFEYLMNDIYRGDIDYLFPKYYSRYIMSKYFTKWKKKTKFDVLKIMDNINIRIIPTKFITKENRQLRESSTSNERKTTNQQSSNMYMMNSQKNYDNSINVKGQRKKKPLNKDYDVSPISLEYHSMKKPRKRPKSEKLFQESLNRNKIGDFTKDEEWIKIFDYCP